MSTSFVSLPVDEPLRIAWPTPNRTLLNEPEKFFARTRVNPDYGKPGWTRDCGKRFHRGCDIAPVSVTPTGRTTVVVYTDCATGRDFESEEPTFVPHDDVFCVCNGVVTEAVADEMASDFGRHVVVEHRWPVSGENFYTLYGHMSEILVSNHQSLNTGHPLGKMGQTSRVADARNWMLVAPHLHFEVRNATGNAYDPLAFLKTFGM
jgi:murein DD-endopeptidase MepM/ murein hydrolase activator NlpD